MSRAFVGKVFVLASLSACLAACEPVTPPPKVATTPPHAPYRGSRIVSFTDTYSVTTVADGGPALWAATNQGLLRWDLAQARYGAFTQKDGLPAGRILALTIDREGAVWVATAAGVARGTRTGWKTYPAAPVGEFIVGMAASPDRDELWAAGPGGLARLRDGKWSRFFDETPVTAMAMAPNGALWLGTTGRGVLRVPRSGDLVEQYGPPEGCEPDLIRAIAAGSDWVLVIGENERGPRAALFDGTRFWSYAVEGGAANVGPAIEWAARGGKEIYVGKDQSFFQVIKDSIPADAHEGVIRFTAIPARAVGARMTPLSDGISSKIFDTLEHLAPPPPPPPKAEPGDKPAGPPFGPPLYSLHESQKLPDGVTSVQSGDRGALVGTRFRGIVRIENGLLRPFQTADITAGAERMTVACTRAEGDECYLATGGERAWRFDGQSFSVAAIDPEPASRVLAVLRDPTGAVLAIHRGAKDTLLRISRVEDGRWSPIGIQGISVPMGAPDLNFASFAPNGHLWIGLRYVDSEKEAIDFGAAEIDLTSGKVLYHRQDPAIAEDAQLPNNVVALAWKGDEAWFATRSGAVRLANGKATTFTENEGLDSEIIHDIEAGTNGEIWAATRRGTGRFDGKRWRFEKLGAFYLPASSIARDSAGHVFLGTDKGMYCYGPCNDDAIDQKRGLLDDVVRDLAVDEHRRVWVLTKKGISIVEP